MAFRVSLQSILRRLFRFVRHPQSNRWRSPYPFGFRRVRRAKSFYGSLMVLGAIAVTLAEILTANPSPALEPLPIITELAASPTEVPGRSRAIAKGSSPEQLLRQGQERYKLGYLQEAAQLWEGAQEGYNRADNLVGEIQAANYLTLSWQNLGRLTDAETLNQTVLDRLESAISPSPNPQLPLLGLKAQALNHRGHLFYSMGQLEEAAETWHQATLAYEQVDDTTGAIGSVVAQARALQALGHHHQGQKLLEEAVLQLQDEPDSQLKAIALRGLGEGLQIVGEVEQAHLALLASQETAEAINAPDDVAAAWIELGHLARRERDNDAALKFYRGAVSVAVTPSVVLRGQLNELQALVKLRSPAAAQKIDPLAAQLNTLSLNHDSLYGRINLADSWLHIADSPQKPLPEFLGETVRLAKTLGDPRAEAFGLYHLSMLYQDYDQLADSQTLAEQALAVAQSLGSNDIAARVALQLGTVRGDRGDRDGAIAAYGQAIQAFGYLRQDLVAIGTDVQFDFRASVEPAYRRLIGLLLQPGASPAEIAQARDVIEDLQVAELDNFFGDSCLTARPESIETLDPKAAVLYPIFVGDSLEVIAAVGDRPLRHFTVEANRQKIDQILAEFHSSLHTAYPIQRQQKLGKIIYDWLITPIQADLEDTSIETLVMVPDGSLRKVPMGAIYDGDRYLVERYQFALSPGLRLLPPVRQRSKSEIFAAGLSAARQGYNALPGVTTELNNISQSFETQLLIDESFTVDEFLHQLDHKSFPIVHLATHGQFSSSPQDTYLLAWSKRLHIQDFDRLFRKRQVGVLSPIDLLVMSACQTAKGDERATLGLAGFALRSGARSTVASLWSVDDQSTSALMTEFYRQLAKADPNDRQGIQKAEALRRAQIKLLHDNRYNHPYYWSAFVLIGNWQ